MCLSYLHKNILMYSSLPLIRPLPPKVIPLIRPLPPKAISLIRPLPPKAIPLIRPLPPKAIPLVKPDFRCIDSKILQICFPQESPHLLYNSLFSLQWYTWNTGNVGIKYQYRSSELISFGQWHTFVGQYMWH